MNRDAFLRHIVLRSGRGHSWKHHARGGTLLREVLGILDKWAARFAKSEPSGQRFVMAHLDTLLKQCNKGPRAEGKHFSLIRLKHVLAELRAQHILSHYFETADHRCGFIVAPHDSLCHVKDGVCVLPDRSVVFDSKHTPSTWQQRVISTLRQHSTRHRDDTQLDTTTTPNSTPLSRIDSTERDTQLDTDRAQQAQEFAQLTDDDIAKWFANGMQFGGPIRVIPSSDVSAHPLNPLIRSVQDELERHHRFLENHKAKKQRQEQPQEQVRECKAFDSKPNTVEATATPKRSRKRPVLSQEAFEQKKVLDALEEFKAELAARPACSKCGGKHEGDCKGTPYKAK